MIMLSEKVRRKQTEKTTDSAVGREIVPYLSQPLDTIKCMGVQEGINLNKTIRGFLTP